MTMTNDDDGDDDVELIMCTYYTYVSVVYELNSVTLASSFSPKTRLTPLHE